MTMTPDPLKVCMLSNLYPPVASGSSIQSSSLARELARRGTRVVVVTARVDTGTAYHERVDNVDVYRLPALRLPRLPIAMNFPWLSFTFTPANARRLEAIYGQHAPDVLHLHNHMFDLGLSAARARRRLGLPLVVTIHTVIRHSFWLYNLALIPADRLLLRRAVIDQSEAVICPDANIVEYARQAWDRTDTWLVPYGITAPERPGDGQIADLRTRHGLHGKRVILSLGHLHSIRNRTDLIAALPHVLRSQPDVRLLIVGAVSTDSAARQAEALGVREAVVLAGPVPHAEIGGYLALSDLEAHWLNQEAPEKTSLGIASLEAMAAGKTVLSVANPDTYGPGVIRNGENAILVEPGQPETLANVILGLLEDTDRRDLIGARAAETIKAHFSWDHVCARTLEVYQQAKASVAHRSAAVERTNPPR